MYKKIPCSIFLLLLSPSSSFAMNEVSQEKQKSILERVSLYNKEKQQRMYISMIRQIDNSLENQTSSQKKEILGELRETFLEKIYVLASSSASKILESHSPVILIFTAGGDILSVIEEKKQEIRQSESVFIFRQKTDLSLEEIQNITRSLKNIHPAITLFIDQEGGEIHRYIDFPSTKELTKILSDDFITSRLSNFSPEETQMFLNFFSVKELYYYPSLFSLSQVYDDFKNSKNGKSFLEMAAYIRLTSLKQAGINTYGLVLDLNRGNPVISNYERSFSKNLEDYKKLVDAFSVANTETNILLYGKHFPGHGIGEIDSHKGVLDISLYPTYTQENMELFDYFLSQSSLQKPGLLVGHMYVGVDFSETFQRIISKAAFVMTDNFNMQGYKLATGKTVAGKFFSTDALEDIIPPLLRLDSSNTQEIQ